MSGPDLSPEAWSAVGTFIATAGATIGAIVVAHLKTSRQATKIAVKQEQLQSHVEDVRKLAEPTGNGYAAYTTGLLEQVIVRLDRMDEQLSRSDKRAARTDRVIVEHLQDHSRAHLHGPPHHREDDDNA